MGASTEPAYAPVATDAPVQQTRTIITSSISQEEELLYRKHAMTLLVICYIQLAISFFLLFQGWFLLSVCGICMVFVGISGARNRRVDLLRSHYIFTMWVYVILMAIFIFSIIYGLRLPTSVFVINFVLSVSQIFGLSSSRAMMTILTAQANGLPISVTVQEVPVAQEKSFNAPQPQYVYVVPTEIDTSESQPALNTSVYPGNARL
eukprot:TRINITY_DN1695_c0_g1_i1.p1 TRINITY_DN1695_c0_g1~~TRINITY_DN1695_c0_g1_i1.p1  ORF type:complete len:206 (-),score=69.20 TRINITY_DN1695_c0_g1_i1:76-693(-)